jgi:iron complex transport system substrate-binding protein
MTRSPQRIVCLSAEAADWLWRIGAWDDVIGVTAYFTPPTGVPPKPRVSSFSTARFDEIIAREPDLVVTFSDVQASLSAELIKRGLSVLATNQRTLAEIEETLALLGRVVNRERETAQLLREFRERLAPVERTADRPRVYFEEWNDPLISGIGWVGELIERAGADDIFPHLKTCRAAPERVVTSENVCRANPQIILASWCGKPVHAHEIANRPGWDHIDAVRANRIHEIPGEDILQPGFRLVHGYEKLKQIVAATVN